MATFQTSGQEFPEAYPIGHPFAVPTTGEGGPTTTGMALNPAVTQKTSGAAVAGSGTVSATPSVVKRSSAAVAGAGTIAAGVGVGRSSGAAVTGAGTVVAGVAVGRTSGALVVGSGAISAGVSQPKLSGASISGSGTVRLRIPVHIPGRPISWCAGQHRPGT